LTDAHAITDASKYIAAVLLALRAMLQLEMPHINVLSKIDLLGSFENLPFNLDYYTEVQDLSYLLQTLENEPRAKHFHKLNKAMCELIEDFGLVGFETLAVEVRHTTLPTVTIRSTLANSAQDKASMMKLVRLVDKVTGYIFMPKDSDTTTEDNMHALFSSVSGLMPGDPYADISDVQERWGERKEEFDKVQEEQWEREWMARKNAEAIAAKEKAKEGAEEGVGAQNTSTL